MWFFKKIGELLSGLRLYLLLPAIGFLLLSTLLFMAGVFWPWGWAMGIVLFMFSGKSSSEKKGYRF